MGATVREKMADISFLQQHESDMTGYKKRSV